MKKVSGYESSRGAFFTKELDAWVDDLDLWLSSHPNGITQPDVREAVLRLLVAGVAEETGLYPILQGIRINSPQDFSEEPNQ